MGAVTAIMYGDRDPSIAGMVLDSPFSSLKTLVEELVKDKVNLPNFVINQALKLVKSTVQKKAHFKLDDIEPIKFAERCFIPALFVAANNDNFVKPHHAKILHDIYPGDKNLVNIEGDHNSHRPRFFKDSATIFFYNTLQVQFIKEISDNYAGYYKKKNDIFEEEKRGYNNNNNKNGEMRESQSKDHNDNSDKKGLIPQVSNDVNLNNLDFDGIEDEEEILKIILEKSKKDFEELESKKISERDNINKNSNNTNSNTLSNSANSNTMADINNNLIDFNNANVNNNIIINSNSNNNLGDFLNSQVKGNNKDNVNEIKNYEYNNNLANNQKKENKNLININSKTNDLINLNLDVNKGKTDRKVEINDKDKEIKLNTFTERNNINEK